MKIWGSQALRAIAFATLIFAVFLPAPITHATQDSGTSTDTPDVTAPVVNNEPLYRVRQGNVANGEIANRFYIERNVLKAESVLAVVGDYDPDGDGWATVGRTDDKNDGKSLALFWMDVSKRPHILLDRDKSTCAQLKLPSFGRVVEGEDRILLVEGIGYCMRPMFIVVPETPTEPVRHDADSSHVDELQENGIVVNSPAIQEIEVRETPQATDANVSTIQQADGLTVAGGESVQIAPPAGNVEGAVTVAPSTSPDTPSKKTDDTTDLTTQVTNTFIVGGSIVSVVLLGIFLLARTSLMLNK